MKKTNPERASELLKDLKYNLFTPEFVSDGLTDDELPLCRRLER